MNIRLLIIALLMTPSERRTIAKIKKEHGLLWSTLKAIRQYANIIPPSGGERAYRTEIVNTLDEALKSQHDNAEQ